MDFFILFFFIMDVFADPHIPKLDISGRRAGNTMLTVVLSFKIQPNFPA